ncbi:MAG: hypothetical protein O3A00_05410 [Planctomycetota bacterium]|nr:hypothetical protein [Planctomycetota bacterium]
MLLKAWLESLVTRRSPRRIRKTHGNTALARAVELCEDRTLLSCISFNEAVDIFSNQTITGATIISHGFQFGDDDGDSLKSLAIAVRDRADNQNGNDLA